MWQGAEIPSLAASKIIWLLDSQIEQHAGLQFGKLQTVPRQSKARRMYCIAFCKFPRTCSYELLRRVTDMEIFHQFPRSGFGICDCPHCPASHRHESSSNQTKATSWSVQLPTVHTSTISSSLELVMPCPTPANAVCRRTLAKWASGCVARMSSYVCLPFRDIRLHVNFRQDDTAATLGNVEACCVQ